MAVPIQSRRRSAAARRTARGVSLLDRPAKRARPVLRVLTASGRPVDTTNKEEAKRIKGLRQGWQGEAWAYRDSIGELRYAERFIANAFRRIRFFPAFYNDPSDPKPMDVLSVPASAGLPPEVAQAAIDTIARLGGPEAMSRLAAKQGANFAITGECWVFGWEDKDTGVETWEIKSVDEVKVDEAGSYFVRDQPSSSQTQSNVGWKPVADYGPETVLARQWVPHPRFGALADAPLRSMLDICEELLITSRSIRAAGRSRLAGAGFLFIPTELDIKVADSDNDDATGGDFMPRLTEAMMTPIGDEGVATAVVPIVIRGPKEYADSIKHILIDRPIDEVQAAQRQELLGRLANGLDLPREVLLGMVDLNHWTAWQVDDNTFRHHIEPSVLEACDAWSASVLRPAIKALFPNLDIELLDRLVVWYDPVELITAPDRTKDAIEAHGKLIISDAALRREMGFADEDAPSNDEMLLRMLRSSRSFPPNIVEGLFHKIAPSLVFPSDTNEPGAGPDGFTQPAATEPADAAGGVGTPSPGAATPADPVPSTSTPAKPALVAAGGRDGRARHVRLARRMVDLDRDLRARLQAAASGAMARVLERAGAKIRTKASKDQRLAAAIDGVRAEFVAGTLGRAVVAAALDLDDDSLIGDPWDAFGTTWASQTTATFEAQLDLAATLAGVALTDAERAELLTTFTENTRSAWQSLAPALSSLATSLLYAPHPDDVIAAFDPSTLVPTGMIRSALAIAGGFGGSITSAGLGDDGLPVDLTEPLGQIATGPVIGDWLRSNGVDSDGYEWVHGPAARPFEPHVSLDGVTFTAFDDESLMNTDSFPDASYFIPGDHDGCTCDFVPLWTPGGGSADDEEAP